MTKTEEMHNEYKDVYKQGVILKDKNGVLYVIMSLTWDSESVICTYKNIEGSQMMRPEILSFVINNFEVVPSEQT